MDAYIQWIQGLALVEGGLIFIGLFIARLFGKQIPGERFIRDALARWVWK